jgi:septal ring factor EnvC (AmiA/AmiB activator)
VEDSSVVSQIEKLEELSQKAPELRKTAETAEAAQAAQAADASEPPAENRRQWVPAQAAHSGGEVPWVELASRDTEQTPKLAPAQDLVGLLAPQRSLPGGAVGSCTLDRQ